MPTTYINIITDLGDIDRLHLLLNGSPLTSPKYFL
jgi:hypothetical protein